MTDEKKLNLNQRLFKGAKGVLEKDPAARWIADKKGLQVDHHLTFLSLCLSNRYKKKIDLSKLKWIELARRNLHEDELIGFLQEEFGFQVKLGLISSDHLAIDENNSLKKEKADIIEKVKESLSDLDKGENKVNVIGP